MLWETLFLFKKGSTLCLWKWAKSLELWTFISNLRFSLGHGIQFIQDEFKDMDFIEP